jgi:hypothetical protein
VSGPALALLPLSWEEHTPDSPVVPELYERRTEKSCIGEPLHISQLSGDTQICGTKWHFYNTVSGIFYYTCTISGKQHKRKHIHLHHELCRMWYGPCQPAIPSTNEVALFSLLYGSCGDWRGAL